MINQDKWINSLPKINLESVDETNQLDHSRWEKTIAKEKFVAKEKIYFPVKKYYLITVLFVCGLLLVPIIKNETRNLQKEINNLKTSINKTKYDLDQAILDNEVITSPENISRLAKEYLNINLVTYKKSQIINLNDRTEKFAKESKIKINNNKKIKNLTTTVKLELAKKIDKRKTEIRKLQELYRTPESIPSEVKTQVAKQIKEKTLELKNLYKSPKDVFTLERIGKWSVVQIVKLFLGMPIVPGK